MSKSRMGRFLEVPDTWEAWAIRVLTVAIVLVFAAAFYLSRQVASLQEYIGESRQQRTSYQQQELARQCTLLRAVGTNPAELRELMC